MKIMFYINVLGGGGAERVIANLANQFVANKYQIIVVTTTRIENEYHLDSWIKRICLNDYINISGNRIIKNLKIIKKLRCVLKKEKPDIIISFMQEPNLRAILAARGTNTKVLISVRNDPEKEYPGKIGRIIGKKILPLADGCVFQTEQAQKWFPISLQKKSAIIFNEVADSFFETSRNSSDNIITIGRLNKQKNQVLLIDAFAEVSKKYPDEKLLIYGEGNLKEFLEKEIERQNLSNRVFLMGTTDRVPEVLSKAKMFVLTSDYEGMPNVLLEAMAVGVPCISTDCPCGGPRTVIESGKNGLIISVNSKNELIKQMEYMLANPNIANKMGITAKKDAERFRPDNVFKEWEHYIQDLLSN